MPLAASDLKTINDAFLLLPEDIQAHSKRVQAYTEAAFKKIVTMDLYISDPRSDPELQIDNLRAISTGALYHDIGKLLPDADEKDEDGKTVHKEHCLHGVDIASELPPAEGRFLPTERRIYLSAIREHHEMVSGGGTPTGKGLKDLAFGGRIVAIADRLDHYAMEARAEDPVTKALDLLREDVKAFRLDPEFYKAFRAVKKKLKDAFEPYRDTAAAVPETIPWIARKSGRPLELRYIDREFTSGGQDIRVREAVMRFKNYDSRLLSYDEMKNHIAAKELGSSVGIYFAFELSDAVRRFGTLNAGTVLYAIEFPPLWYGTPEFRNELLTVLSREKLAPERFILILPDKMTKPQEAAFSKQADALKTDGFGIFRRGGWNEALKPGDSAERSETEIAEEAIRLSGGNTEPAPEEGGDAG